MLAGIITTIIMALGIATGNISSNAYKGGNVLNTSQETLIEAKPQPKRQQDTINIQDSYKRVQIYTNANITKEYTKWYIGQNATNSNYWNGYVALRNTTYAMWQIEGNFNTCSTDAYMSITNYYRSSITYNVRIELVMLVSGTLYWSKGIYHTQDNIDDLFDITLTENSKTYITQLRNSKNWITDYSNSGADGYNQNQTVDLSNQIEITLEAQETINLQISFSLTRAGDYATMSAGTPKQFSMTGTAILPDMNYEVVDIPNLMYTILVMPFSFISTAFNLTIFPNTPYALNFSNLFMTLVSIFVLLWILKKVFK